MGCTAIVTDSSSRLHTGVKEALRDGDTLAHIGEETLGVLLADVSDPDEANTLAANVMEWLNRPFCVDVQRVYFQSVHRRGVAAAATSIPKICCETAAIAMNRAKAQRDARRSSCSTRRMRRHVAVRVQKEADLRRAIEREEFQVYYQPIVSLDSGKLAGFEALVRWAHRDGLRLPGDFIPAGRGDRPDHPDRKVCAEERHKADAGVGRPT